MRGTNRRPPGRGTSILHPASTCRPTSTLVGIGHPAAGERPGEVRNPRWAFMLVVNHTLPRADAARTEPKHPRQATHGNAKEQDMTAPSAFGMRIRGVIRPLLAFLVVASVMTGPSFFSAPVAAQALCLNGKIWSAAEQ